MQSRQMKINTIRWFRKRFPYIQADIFINICITDLHCVHTHRIIELLDTEKAKAKNEMGKKFETNKKTGRYLYEDIIYLVRQFQTIPGAIEKCMHKWITEAKWMNLSLYTFSLAFFLFRYSQSPIRITRTKWLHCRIAKSK